MAMSGRTVSTVCVLLGLLAGTGAVIAQQPPPGPTSQAPTAKPPEGAVLVDGALAVPGALAGETVPAKFSAKNAADDALITVAYTFKTLSDEERRLIYQSLKDLPAGSAHDAEVGDELPFAVDLRAVPDAVAARVPQVSGYQFANAGNRVLLVSPPTRIVVGSFSDANEPQAVGRRAR
jgi:hypothetical protein